MGFFLTDAISSAFTPRGTNARRKQEQGQQQIGDQAAGIATGAGKNWADTLSFLQTQNGNIQGGIDALGRSTTAAGLRDNAIRGGNASRSAALSKSVPIQYQSNPWMAQAYRAQQMNAANDSQNQAIQKSTSPQAQAQALGLLLQMMQGAEQNAYAPFGQAAGLVYGQPEVKVSPGLLDQIAPFIGLFAGQKSGQSQGGSSQNMQYDVYQDENGNYVDAYGNPTRFR